MTRATKKKLFWVTRYSLGKTLSKELLIEHEFSNDETRHRLIEIHSMNEDEKKHHLLLVFIALLLNPPIGLIACLFALLSKRRSKNLQLAFVSHILSIISIGLTIGMISALLLYYFVRDIVPGNIE